MRFEIMDVLWKNLKEKDKKFLFPTSRSQKKIFKANNRK